MKKLQVTSVNLFFRDGKLVYDNTSTEGNFEDKKSVDKVKKIITKLIETIDKFNNRK